jgi:KRAB domain-containing zinc finger protein
MCYCLLPDPGLNIGPHTQPRTTYSNLIYRRETIHEHPNTVWLYDHSYSAAALQLHTHDHPYAIPSNNPEQRIASNVKRYQCQKCENVFRDLKYLRAHEKTHRKVPVCNKCGIRFKYGTDLRTHNYFEHRYKYCSVTANGYECHKCDTTFTTRKQLVRHNLQHHVTRRDKTPMFVCPQCKVRCRSMPALRLHFAEHGSVMPFRCDVCDERFLTPHRLGSHMRAHNHRTTFGCPDCPKHFVTATTLQRHLKHHLDTCRKCEICDRFFNDAASYNKHMLKHSSLLVCDICAKTFNKYSNFMHHKRRHRATRSHHCTICDKNFLSRHELREHILIHKQLKPHLCDQCGRSFAHRKSLTVHMNVHIPGNMRACKKSDKSDGSLTTRIETIHGDGTNTIVPTNAPCLCSVCGKSFVSSRSFRNHMRVHDGTNKIKRHQCEVCGQKFRRPYLLRKHMTKHAGELTCK